MSIECGECGRDARGGHGEECSRHPKNEKAVATSPAAGGLEALQRQMMEHLKQPGVPDLEATVDRLLELCAAEKPAERPQLSAEQVRVSEAVLWREAIFTGTSADLMAWIKKRWQELNADALLTGEAEKVPPPLTVTAMSSNEFQQSLEGHADDCELRQATLPMCTAAAMDPNRKIMFTCTCGKVLAPATPAASGAPDYTPFDSEILGFAPAAPLKGENAK